MGVLRQVNTGKEHRLECNHRIGRSPGCSLILPERTTSGLHALLLWTGGHWAVRDLGSRNGTYLNGKRLGAGEFPTVGRHATLSFGVADALWELIDDSSPEIMAVPTIGGDPVTFDGALLAIPTGEQPIVTIFRGVDGTWQLERPDESITPIADQQTFEAAGQIWRFSCPDALAGGATTSLAGQPADLETRHIVVHLSVSRDEEVVGLQLACAGISRDLGSRSHNYLLLTLARRRLSDSAEGISEGECGWLYLDEVAHDPAMAPSQLNVDVFRVRKQFAAAGVVDAAAIIERRPRTRQIRIGTPNVVVARR